MQPSLLSALLALGAVSTASTLPPLGYERKLLADAVTKRQSAGGCLGADAPSTTANKTNVWGPITPADNLAVWNLLHANATGLNLTNPANATLTDNYVFWIDTVHTNKSDVLPYIDGDGPMPAKYARAVIFEGGKDIPGSQEYMVGPLPVSNTTTIEPLDYVYNGGAGGHVPFNARYADGPKSRAIEPLIKAVMTNISDITQALFQGAAYFGSSDPRTNLSSTATTPLSFDGTQGWRVMLWRFPGPASYLTPIDFYTLFDVPGTDPSHYKLRGFVTNSKFFASEEELRTAFEAGELAQQYDQTTDTDWALVDYKPELGVRNLEDQFAPSSIELGGKRYKVDMENQYVEYMGWSFYLSYTRTFGIMFYDIKFKGERILYELSLQEALAQYAGNQPKAAGTVYHDTYCNSSYGFTRLGVTKGAALITRAIATIGNYDYNFDYKFHQDGSLEVVVRASGYLQSSFYYPDQAAYGPRIQVATQGSLHDHILNFKADFDILGTANSFQVSDLVTVNVSQPWFPELGNFSQMQLQTSNLETEDTLEWAGNGQALYVVTNEDETNAWGEKRGYRILPGRSDVHLKPLDSPFSQKNAEFAKHHLAITRQHDTEPWSNSFQNVNLPAKPQQDFSKFFDGESLAQEDLVVWFNLGMHHFVRAEDIPVTLYTEAYSSIIFAPQNFFDRAQDGDLLNRRYITVDPKTGVASYETYNVSLPMCMVELTEPVEALIHNEL